MTVADVRQLAEEALADVETDEQTRKLVDLIDAAEPGAVTEALTALAPVLPDADSDAHRSWVCVLLWDALGTLPSDPLYGLIALTDFWETMGRPAWKPHSVQGIDDALTPNEYYTDDRFNLALTRHSQWLEREVARIGGVLPTATV